MSDETKRAGLGKVIYSVDAKSDDANQSDKEADQADVLEADEESFPASDPPGFAGGSEAEPT